MEMMEIAGKFRRREWNDLLDADLAPAAHVPTMLSDEECKLYVWLGQHWGVKDQAIVDLGSFIGGSTARLAAGAKGSGAQIHAYDRFTANEPTKRGQLYNKGIAPFEGDDILELSKELLAAFAPDVHHHKGELAKATWDGTPISILTLDASKDPSKMDIMADTFFPSLVAGQSVIVQQDFLHWRQPWVPAQMELWHDHFLPLATVPEDTVVFLCTKTPSAADLETRRVGPTSDEELLELIKQARRRYQSFLPRERLDRAIKAVRKNPGVRIAWQMEAPEEPQP